MQCSIGALYIIILFFETRNYIKFKFYIIAGKKRPPQLRKSGRLFPQLARCGLFCALSFRALGTVQRTMGRSYQCCTVRQQKNYLLYLFDIYLFYSTYYKNKYKNPNHLFGCRSIISKCQFISSKYFLKNILVRILIAHSLVFTNCLP